MTRLYPTLFLLLLPAIAPAATPTFSKEASQAILPPLRAWNGKSRELIAPKNDPWITPIERSGFRLSPNYNETIAWLRKLLAAAPQLHMVSIGKSPEGRDIWMVIATKETDFTPEALSKSSKPVILAQAGIHAGEIDGKDAGLMLLRDMTVRGTKRDLLEHAHFLFVPIFNVDGHEHSSKFSRANQRGPDMMGWRTNARNLNLNRDYAKVDSPEMAAMVALLNRWSPDLYLDLHVTDGADFQYDITFDFSGKGGYSPTIAAWLEKVFAPRVTSELASQGHVPGPAYVGYWVDQLDVSKGITSSLAPPRFSTSYADLRHIPAVLLETHSLKPYERRVLGTYVFLEAALRVAIKDTSALRAAASQDRNLRQSPIPLTWDIDPKAPAESFDFRGVETRISNSDISGGKRIEFGEALTNSRVPLLRRNHVATFISRPKAYWVPASRNDLISRLQIHGIRLERITEPQTVKVTMYRLEDAKYETQPFEGHIRVNAKPVIEKRVERFAPGSARVPLDQTLGDLAAILLEPSSPDSFFQWGLLNEIFQATEYIEPYAIEPMAERMLKSDPNLAREFHEKLSKDDTFRGSPEARLRWFYLKTPFADERHKLYPIAREE